MCEIVCDLVIVDDSSRAIHTARDRAAIIDHGIRCAGQAHGQYLTKYLSYRGDSIPSGLHDLSME